MWYVPVFFQAFSLTRQLKQRRLRQRCRRRREVATRTAKKAIGSDWQNNNYARASHFLYISSVIARLRREST